MASTDIRWVPPLPNGWEGKYDPTQKRYFFINHVLKTTTWNDPRFAPVPTPQPMAQAMRPQVASGGYPVQQQHHRPAQQAEALPMKTMVQDFLGNQEQGASSSNTSPQRFLLQQHTRHHYVDDSEEEEEEDLDLVLDDMEADDIIMHELRTEYPTCPPGKIRGFLERNLNAKRATELDIEALGFEKVSNKPETQHSNRAEAQDHSALIQKLEKSFPNAGTEMITDLLVQYQYAEYKTRAELRMMGFREVQPGVKEPTLERHRDLASEQRESNRAAAAVASSSSSPAKPVLSASEKNRLVTKLSKDFPNLDRSIISLAMETNGDDEGKARRMLHFMYADTPTSPQRSSPSKQASPPKTTGSSAYSRLTTTTTAGPSNVYTRPIAGDVNRAASPTRVTSPKRVTSPVRVTSPKRVTSPVRVTSPIRLTTPSPTSSKQASKAKQLSDYLDQTTSYDILGLLDGCCVKPLDKPDTETDQSEPSVSKINVVTNQRQVLRTRPVGKPAHLFTSENRTIANGPDSTLAEGADSANVERYGVAANGPDRQLVHGPNRSLVRGSQGAVGSDPSLRRGPQADLRHGPQRHLCRGPEFLRTNKAVLVTHI